MNRKRLSLVFVLGAVAAIGFYLWWHRRELASVVVVSPFYLAFCALGVVVCLAANGLILYVMISRLGSRIGIWECLNLSLVTSAMNIVTPMQGGMVVRAVYLKRLHDFQYSQYLATLIGRQVLMMIVCSGMAAIALAWMAFADHRYGWGAALAGAVVCLGIAVLARLFPRIRPQGNWLLDRIAAVSDAWYRLRSQPRLLATLTVLVGVQVAGELFSFWTAFGAIGIQAGLVEVTIAGTLGVLASTLSITPGALGIYEAVVAFVGAGVAIAPIHSVMASLVSRAVVLVLLMVLAPFAILFLKRHAPVSAAILSSGERPT
ncbi:lysylphosphatidylglycerol synthase transmembrane domain-containing protein [Candidatus Methylomirabilis sp.]|uniref:lysylphosphatidylglycerol synthase transmembrane domain-containing protein n=1 Tax=Candidatus Methylomirabilis sp. TaxID=2032687 RepID=UPI00307652B4